jgi:hypothetical protein
MKKTLSVLLALVMCLSFIPMTAMAAVETATFNGQQYQMIEIGMSWTEAKAYCENLGGHLVVISSAEEQAFIENWIATGTKNYYWLGGYCDADRVFKWVTGEPMNFTAWASGEPNNYQGKQDKIMMYRVANPMNAVSQYKWDDIRNEGTVDGEPFFSESSFGFICEFDNVASGWARGELAKADALGLIPDSLRNSDLSKSITRAEFAAVAVKVYENLTGKKAVAAQKNPFTDTKDAEVLKALNENLMVGVSDDKFDPDTLLNREQAATALTRVLCRSYIPGWTLATSGNYTLNFTMPAKFADDAKISDWAKSSVYFMAAKGIISGTGSNMFSPRATTPAEVAVGYASATREQAIIIGMRLVDNLKDKPLDYTGGN